MQFQIEWQSKTERDHCICMKALKLNCNPSRSHPAHAPRHGHDIQMKQACLFSPMREEVINSNEMREELQVSALKISYFLLRIGGEFRALSTPLHNMGFFISAFSLRAASKAPRDK